MPLTPTHTDTAAALDRLIEVARGNTHQSARVANFLLAWWNGREWGFFDLTDLFAVDAAIAADMTTIFAFLGQHPGAIYADGFDRREAMVDLVERWHNDAVALRQPLTAD